MEHHLHLLGLSVEESMDHHPLISKMNDLIIMFIAGISIQLSHFYIAPMTIQTQFLLILFFSFFSGLFMSYLYQSIEWALFFALGIQTITIIPFALFYIQTKTLPLNDFLMAIYQSGHHTLFLLSSWLVGIPVGFLFQKFIMGNYYKERLF